MSEIFEPASPFSSGNSELSEPEKLEALDKKIRSIQVDLTSEPPEPKPALMIEDQIWGTMGNFSLVIGKAKSGKTFLMNMAMAAAINDNYGCIRGCLPPEKRKVIYFDTEQGSYHVWKTGNRVLQMTEKSPNETDNLIIYKLRGIDTAERVKIINRVLETTKNIGLIIIDGIRDLIPAINDEEYATKVSNWLLRITDESDNHVVVLLHQNKTDQNARGHIGTELINKAETTISVSGTNERLVKPEYCRNPPFENFAFRINDEGLAEIVDSSDVLILGTGYDNSNSRPLSISNETHKQNIDQIFKDEPELTYATLCSKIRNRYGVGTNTSKDIVTHLYDEKILFKKGKDGTKAVRYSNKPFDP